MSKGARGGGRPEAELQSESMSEGEGQENCLFLLLFFWGGGGSVEPFVSRVPAVWIPLPGPVSGG